MKNIGNHTDPARTTAPEAQERAAVPFEEAGRTSAAPGPADAPQGAERGSSKRKGPKWVDLLPDAIGKAEDVGSCGFMLARKLEAIQAAERARASGGMTAEQRDAERARLWHEAQLVLADHADAMIKLVQSFIDAGYFRKLDEAEWKRNREERRAAALAALKAADEKKGGEA